MHVLHYKNATARLTGHKEMIKKQIVATYVLGYNSGVNNP